MKKFLYEIFTADTDSTSYKKVTLNFLLASIAPIVLFFICNLIPIGNVFRFILLIPMFTFIWMLLMFFVRLMHVSDNKTLINIKRKGYKFKYKPIDLSIQDFEFWLENAEVPETIYVKSKKGINYKFEISFEVKGKNGPFYNKEFYLDDNKINDIKECLRILYELDIIYNDRIKVFETFDRNSPDTIISIISDLKTKFGKDNYD